VLEGVAIAILAVLWALWLWYAWLFARIARLPNLRTGRTPPEPTAPWPKLSVVVACRNEEAGVRQALSSLLSQDYPDTEIIVVDDRSDDGTGAILRELATEHPVLRMVRVDTLPAGWLGKTHAMQVGAAAASGEWILFTDADVVFAPGVLRRAVAWVERERLGHGVALPLFVAPGFLERSFVALFGLVLLIYLRVDELRRPGSRAHVGVGAFNLVRRDAYRAIGGHERLRMEVADDVKLGLVLRRSGVRQGCADSGGLVSVRWQRGFAATLRGLMKNLFAGNEYSWRLSMRSVIGLPLATMFPLLFVVLSLAVPHGTGAAWTVAGLLAAGAWLTSASLHGLAARRFAGGQGLEGLALPLVGLCLGGVALASALAASARGAVIWRGTRYPLSELKAAVVRDAQWPRDRAPG
jgi:glycosyltransferase involved in cell wall biosynthesis